MEGKEVEFDLYRVATAPTAVDDRTCFKVDSIDELVRETQALQSTPSKDEGIDATKLYSWKFQESHDDLEAEENVPLR